jgi:predicted dienelactone hydrolase
MDGYSARLARRCFVFLLVALGAEVSTAADANGSAASSPTASLPLPSAVGIQVREYADATRRAWDDTGPRPVRTTIWYPTNRPPVQRKAADEQGALFVADDVSLDAPLAERAGGYSLLVVSHGTGGSALGMQWFAAGLASRGFIVAAVDHHGNTGAEPRPYPQGFMLWWERPKDLTVVVDHVLQDATFGTQVDRSRIGAAGFSLGGYTVITLAGARIDRDRYQRFCNSAQKDFTCGPQSEYPEAPARFESLIASDPVVRKALQHSGDNYRDLRIRAVYAMAPVFGMGFDRQDVADVRVPIRIVVGAGDSVAPTETNAKRYASLISDAEFNELGREVGHYDFAPECTNAGRAQGIRICEASEGRGGVHRQTVADAYLFFARTLKSP